MGNVRDYLKGFIKLSEKERNELIEILEYFVAMEQKNYICPRCSTWNETWEKRERTVKSDEVHCWRCGQLVRIGGLDA